MKVWVDPKETTAEAWVGAAADDSSEPTSPAASVVERATRTRYPIQYTDGAFLTPAAAESGGLNAGGYARVQFNCAVDGRGTIKLTARGYQWGGDGPDRRFKALYTREADPTDTIPFGTYERWRRSQHGTVDGFEGGDEYVDFDPSEGTIEETREECPWETLWDAVRLRLVELELVRNTPFARYRLREHEKWAEIGGTLRWKPTAFGDAEP